MRELATIRTIKNVKPIPGADFIERIQIDGWWCVSQKGSFNISDKCIYFEIDSLLPLIEQFAFLANKGTKKMLHDGEEVEGYRLRTIKLRGQISQGLALPLSAFPEVDESMGDVTELLNILLYEPPIPSCLDGEVHGVVPGFIPHTKEYRVQNVQDLLDINRGKVFTLTEKIDGTSSTFYKHEGHFGVCGHNWEYKETEKNTYWEMAHKYDLENVVKNGFAIQGEICGEGIQGNPLKIKGHELRVFFIWDIVAKRYLSTSEMINVCHDNDLQYIPIIDDAFVLDHTIDELLIIAEGKSQLCETAEREGIVFVLNDPDDESTNGKTSFKAISNKYIL